jgi:hypothetical protein
MFDNLGIERIRSFSRVILVQRENKPDERRRDRLEKIDGFN